MRVWVKSAARRAGVQGLGLLLAGVHDAPDLAAALKMAAALDAALGPKGTGK